MSLLSPPFCPILHLYFQLLFFISLLCKSLRPVWNWIQMLFWGQTLLSNEISFVKLGEMSEMTAYRIQQIHFIPDPAADDDGVCLWLSAARKTSVSQTPAVWTKQTETSGNTVVMDFCPLEFHALRQILRTSLFLILGFKYGKLNFKLDAYVILVLKSEVSVKDWSNK